MLSQSEHVTFALERRDGGQSAITFWSGNVGDSLVVADKQEASLFWNYLVKSLTSAARDFEAAVTLIRGCK